MIELTPRKYAELAWISQQAVYKKINSWKLNTKDKKVKTQKVIILTKEEHDSLLTK